MKYIDFYQKFKNDLIIKTSDIFLVFPKFDIKDVSKWQKKWYIKKIRKGFYIFSDQKLNHPDLFYIANNLNYPSYVWLYSALSYYSIIPEWVFNITSISTKRINNQNTIIWNFNYQTIKKELFWWYIVKSIWEITFYISDLEKTILDFLYFYSNIKVQHDFEWMRFNREEIKEKLNLDKIEIYLKIFNNKKLNMRFNNFKKYIYA